MIANPNILNVQVVPSTPMFISSNSPGQKQVMHPEWIQWYRAIQTRVGGATGTLITAINISDISTAPIYTITNTENTSSGTGIVTITFDLKNKDKNLIFAGPETGSSAEPTFRLLINNDLPVVNILHGGTGLTTIPTDGQLLIGDSATNAYVVANIIGTLDRLDVTNGSGTISLDIDANYIGQSSITTLGTITSGVWNATTIGIGHGGTGLASSPTSGQILIGDIGGNYQLNTISNGTGINITNGSASISIALTNTTVIAGSYTLPDITIDATGRITAASNGTAGGVTSLAGTTNQIVVSASTGAITLSFDQNIIIPASATGVSLTVNGSALQHTMDIIAAATAGNVPDIQMYRTASTANSQRNGSNITMGDTGSNTYSALQHSGGQLEFWQFNGSSWTQMLGLTGLPTTGTTTALLSASNKPGTNNQTTPITWLPIVYNGGTVGYVPIYAP